MSELTAIELRARALDQASKVRLLSSTEIDTEKYLKANDVSHKVHDANVFLAEVEQDILNPRVEDGTSTMPWSKTHDGFQFRPGEVTVYAGSNGGGKSLITGQIALGLIKQGQRICIASFEMKPKRTLYRMLRQFSGENIERPQYVDKILYVTKLLSRFAEFARDKLWLYDQQGTTSAHQVIAMSRYCAVELGVQHIFIDSLMKCVSGEDDYNAQKSFVDELTSLARDHNVHIHLVHHIRKLGNEEVMPSKSDIKGTGAIADQVDNVLMVFRNKKKEHQAQAGQATDPAVPDAYLMCEKQRNGEAEDWYSLWYHRDSQQFLDGVGNLPVSFDDRGTF